MPKREAHGDSAEPTRAFGSAIIRGRDARQIQKGRVNYVLDVRGFGKGPADRAPYAVRVPVVELAEAPDIALRDAAQELRVAAPRLTRSDSRADR